MDKDKVEKNLGLKSLNVFRKQIDNFPVERRPIIAGTLEQLIMCTMEIEAQLGLDKYETIFIMEMLCKVLEDFHFNIPKSQKTNPEEFKKAVDQISNVQ